MAFTEGAIHNVLACFGANSPTTKSNTRLDACVANTAAMRLITSAYVDNQSTYRGHHYPIIITLLFPKEHATIQTIYKPRSFDMQPFKARHILDQQAASNISKIKNKSVMNAIATTLPH